MANDIKFRALYFRDDNIYATGVGILENGTPVRILIADKDPVTVGGSPRLSLKVMDIEIEDLRPPRPSMFDKKAL